MKDQSMLVSAFQTIKAVAAHPGKKDKELLLKRGDSPYLRALLVAAYDKFQTYRIQQIEQPTQYNTVQPDTMEEFQDLCKLLASHTVGSNEAKARVKRFLALNTVEGAAIFTAALLRDLRGGFDEKTCNKAFPGLIPVFSVQLANKMEDWDALKYPLIVETKYDGVRSLAVSDGTSVRFYSREGREFDECGVIAKQVAQLAPGMPFVLDGEFIAVKFNPKSKTCMKNKDSNWPFSYGLSLVKTQDKTAQEVEEHLGYIVWDVVDHEYFTSQGLRGRALDLTARKAQLTGLFERRGLFFGNLKQAPNYVCTEKQQVLDFFQKMLGDGQEGAMIKDPTKPYEFKRSNAVLKLKEFFSMDLRVVGFEEGTGKYVGMLGALHVADDEGKIRTKVGSGYTDSDRLELYVELLTGRLQGQIVQVSAQEVTQDGSLRFPTFECLRSDKTTTNTEGLV